MPSEKFDVREIVEQAGTEVAEAREEERRSRSRLRWVTVALMSAIVLTSVAPAAANHLVVRTSDLVKGAVTTPKIATGAVGAEKLKTGSVKTPKIGSRAVTSGKMAREVPGVAVAGVSFLGTTTEVTNWFNRFGGAPTVTRLSAGVYEVAFPGLEGRLGFDAIISMTVSNVGYAYESVTGNDDVIQVITTDAALNPADRFVDVVVHSPNPGGS